MERGEREHSITDARKNDESQAIEASALNELLEKAFYSKRYL
jgi:hypothetical protein